MRRALAKLTSIASQVGWWQDGQGCPQMLADGDAVMAIRYNGRVDGFRQGGALIGVQRDGALIRSDCLVIPKGSPEQDTAMDLIAWITSAEHNAELSNYNPLRTRQRQRDGPREPGHGAIPAIQRLEPDHRP